VLAAVVSTAVLTTLLPTPASAVVPVGNPLNVSWWAVGATPQAAINKPDCLADYATRRAGVLSAANGAVSPGIATMGDVFYLVIDYTHDPNAGVCMSFNGYPRISLPPGLVRADDRTPTRCGIGGQEQLGIWGCSLAGTATSFRIVRNSDIAVDDRGFRMSVGVTWRWLVPVRATTALALPNVWVAMDGVEPGIWSGSVALALKTYAGNPYSPIWNYWRTTGGISLMGSLVKHGPPTDVEHAVPWRHPKVPSTPVGTVQNFEGPNNLGETLTWSPLYGTHPILGDFRKVWLTWQSYLGPARGPVVIRAGGHARQEFAGGFIVYNAFSEATTLGGIYCWDNVANC
jgi:hypothetical protein